MRPLDFRLVLWLLTVAALPAPALAEPALSAPSRTVLILDASGSMWGRVEGRPKIAIAREVIGDLLEGWSADDALGLTAYGHRRRADCSDIERLVPLAPGSAKALRAAVEQISPTGKTPIGASIVMAAEELRYRTAPATVILVSDGRETCDVDPCELSAALARDGFDFTAHVVGFDVTEEERAGLACIASATGGIFVAARDASELRSAIASALAKATRVTTPGLWLGAALAAQRDIVKRPVAWELVRVEADGSDGERVHASSSPTLFLTPRSGPYRATAELDGVRGYARFDYEAGTSHRQVVGLGAGRLIVSADEGGVGQALEGAVRFDIYAGRKRVAASDEASASFVLPAGRYRVTSEHGGYRHEQAVDLAAGQDVRARFRFGKGRLSLRAVLSEGGRPIELPLHWEIRKAGPDQRVVRQPVASREKATWLIELASGRYEVEARLGEAVARSLVDLAPGALRTHTIDLGAGTARVFASLPPPGGAIRDPVHWRVFALQEGGEPVAVAEHHGATHSFVLPAGKYRIHGRLPGMSGDSVVEVAPGASSALGVELR